MFSKNNCCRMLNLTFEEQGFRNIVYVHIVRNVIAKLIKQVNQLKDLIIFRISVNSFSFKIKRKLKMFTIMSI